MIHVVLVLIPFLLVDIINPPLLAGTIYGLGTKKPYANSAVMLLSFLCLYLLAGIAIALGLESVIDYFSPTNQEKQSSPYFDYALELLLALLLFYLAAKQSQERDTHSIEELERSDMTLKEAATIGILINVVGLPFAIPYLAAIDQILKADLHFIQIFFVLLVYNIFYILPYASLLLIRFTFPHESDRIFGGINSWMHRVTTKWMPWVFFLLGLLLVEDAVSFLLGYREYSFLELL